MPITVTTSEQQITAQVTGDNSVTATVSAGIGPAGPAGPPGEANLPSGDEGDVLTYTGGVWVAAAPSGGVSSWNDLLDKPQTFPPSSHTHTAAAITDFAAAVSAAAPPTTDASLLTSGTLADARLSANVVLSGDARLADARQPLAHTHTLADITDSGTAAGFNADQNLGTADPVQFLQARMGALLLDQGTGGTATMLFYGEQNQEFYLPMDRSGTLALAIACRSDTVGGTSYIGTAPSGTAPATAAWRIRRTTVAANGTISAVATATNVAWNDRLTATYS